MYVCVHGCGRTSATSEMFIWWLPLRTNRACLEELRRQGRPVYTYPYDWRRSLFEAVDGLIAYLEEVCVLLVSRFSVRMRGLMVGSN